MLLAQICDALRDLVPFVQFKKREKHPWRSVNFRLKLTLLHRCCSRFLNCTIGTKSRNAPNIINIKIQDSRSYTNAATISNHKPVIRKINITLNFDRKIQ